MNASYLRVIDLFCLYSHLSIITYNKSYVNEKDYTYWLDDILCHHHVFCANAKRCVNLSAQNGYCFIFGILFSAAPKQLRTKSLVKLCCSVSF